MSGGRRVVGLIQPEAKPPFEHVDELVLVDVQVKRRAPSRAAVLSQAVSAPPVCPLRAL
jgi:hypothetical protein